MENRDLGPVTETTRGPECDLLVMRPPGQRRSKIRGRNTLCWWREDRHRIIKLSCAACELIINLPCYGTDDDAYAYAGELRTYHHLWRQWADNPLDRADALFMWEQALDKVRTPAGRWVAAPNSELWMPPRGNVPPIWGLDHPLWRSGRNMKYGEYWRRYITGSRRHGD